ncbi:MAG: hypothetical protein II004_05805 [Erysipelotrichaceae bacterium]|nr:hypothetical protein [Erysipelotrichaceae bacterium]
MNSNLILLYIVVGILTTVVFVLSMEFTLFQCFILAPVLMMGVRSMIK